MVSTRAINPGSLIIQNDPIVIGPPLDPTTLPLCTECHQKNSKPCQKCKYHICKSCLKKNHDKICTKLQKLDGVDHGILTLFKLLNLMEENEKVRKIVENLKANVDEVMKSTRWQYCEKAKWGCQSLKGKSYNVTKESYAKKMELLIDWQI